MKFHCAVLAEDAGSALSEATEAGPAAMATGMLTLSEVVEMGEKDVRIVARSEPLEVVLGHLAQLLPVDILK